MWLPLLAAVWAGLAVGTLIPGMPSFRPAGPGPASRLAGLIRERIRPAAPAPALELVTGLVAELSAGQPTDAALRCAATGLTPNPCPQAVSATEHGGSVAEALRRDAAESGSLGLSAVAACWEVAEHSGAGLASALQRLADGLRSSDQANAQLSGEIAAVRSSARLLAGLPVLGLAVGQWIGAQPLVFLTASWPGRGVLAGGLGLQAVGVLWLHRMVAKVRAEL